MEKILEGKRRILALNVVTGVTRKPSEIPISPRPRPRGGLRGSGCLEQIHSTGGVGIQNKHQLTRSDLSHRAREVSTDGGSHRSTGGDLRPSCQRCIQ